MDEKARLRLASELVRLADELEDDEGEIDPNFVMKVRAIKMQMNKLVPKKRRKLRTYGIGLIRPNSTVEDLIDALGQVIG